MIRSAAARAAAGRAGRARRDRRAGRARRSHPGGEVSGRRREEVAAVEGARDRVERVVRVRQLVRGVDPGTLGGGDQESVVGPDVGAALLVAQRERTARAPDAGVDDGEVRADRHVRDRVREHERPWRICCAGIPCVMSMICASGAIRLITPWQVPTKSS